MPVLCGINRDNFGAMVVAAGKPPARANGWGIAPDATRYVNILTGAIPAGVSRASGIVFDSDGDLCMTVSKSGARLYQGFLRRDDGVMVATYNPPGAGARMVHAPIGPLLVDADGAVHISGGFDGTNLAAWYRFGAGITQAGGFASAWADQSGLGRDLTQGTGAAQPAVNPDGSLLFNGTAHWMQALFTLPQPATVCMLAKPVSWTNADRAWSGGTGSSRLSQTTATPQIAYAQTTGTTASADATIGNYHSIIVVANDTNNVLRVNNTTEQTGGGGSGALGGITLCATSAGANNGNFEIKEVVIFSEALSLARRAAMATYLASVGGITI